MMSLTLIWLTKIHVPRPSRIIIRTIYVDVSRLSVRPLVISRRPANQFFSVTKPYGHRQKFYLSCIVHQIREPRAQTDTLQAGLPSVGRSSQEEWGCIARTCSWCMLRARGQSGTQARHETRARECSAREWGRGPTLPQTWPRSTPQTVRRWAPPPAARPGISAPRPQRLQACCRRDPQRARPHPPKPQTPAPSPHWPRLAPGQTTLPPPNRQNNNDPAGVIAVASATGQADSCRTRWTRQPASLMMKSFVEASLFLPKALSCVL